MSELARAIGAPVTLKLKADGPTYLFGPITLGDFGAVQRHMQQQLPDYLGEAVKAAGLTTDRQLQKMLLDDARAELKNARDISLDAAAHYATETQDGLALLLWLGTEKNKPGAFTHQTALDTVLSLQVEGMQALATAIVEAAGMDDPNRQAPTDGAPTGTT